MEMIVKERRSTGTMELSMNHTSLFYRSQFYVLTSSTKNPAFWRDFLKIETISRLTDASLRVLPALRMEPLAAGIWIFCDGLRGLTPMRARRLEMRNVPEPVDGYVVPCLSSFVTGDESLERIGAARFVSQKHQPLRR